MTEKKSLLSVDNIIGAIIIIWIIALAVIIAHKINSSEDPKMRGEINSAVIKSLG